MLQDARLAAGAAKAAAESYVDDIHDYIDSGRSFQGRTGALQQSINWRPSADGAIVFAGTEYAPYIERGTGLHGPHAQSYTIRPRPGRKSLRWPIAGGGYAFARAVEHPGIRARPFFYADFQDRETRMIEAMRRYIARRLVEAG